VEKDPAKLQRLADELAEALYERDNEPAAKSARNVLSNPFDIIKGRCNSGSNTTL
jgi:hypothetical protein